MGVEPNRRSYRTFVVLSAALLANGHQDAV
jgi:hypothetical protein